MHGPAYGAQKAGVDKLAADMAVDFDGTGVCTVSIWMGILLTEKFRRAFDGHPRHTPRRPDTPRPRSSPDGVIDALHSDPALAELERPDADRCGTRERGTASRTRMAASRRRIETSSVRRGHRPLWSFADAGPGGLRH